MYINSYKKYYTFGKTVNSIGFILVAVYGGVALGNMDSFYCMLPALIMCLCGDVLLGVNTQIDCEKCFLAGIFSFTAAHIAFTYAFSKFVPLAFYDFIFPVIAIFITYKLSFIKNMDIEKGLRKYVLMYSFFVTLLLSKSMGILFITGLSVKSILIFVGALFFFISDFIILFLYFYKKKHHLVGTFNLLFYYSGMFLLALSVWY